MVGVSDPQGNEDGIDLAIITVGAASPVGSERGLIVIAGNFEVCDSDGGPGLGARTQLSHAALGDRAAVRDANSGKSAET